MAYGIGSTSKGRSGAASSVATAAVAVATGSTIVVGIVWSNAVAFTSVTDNAGNVYTQSGVERAPSAGTDHARYYYCQNAIGNAALAVTLTVGASTNLEIVMTELTGMAAASFDQQNSNPDTASPFTSGNITTASARQVIVAFIAGDSGSNPATHAESTGFTVQAGAEETNGASFWTSCMATRLATSAATFGASFTETGATRAAVFIASFREASGMGAQRNLRGPRFRGRGPRARPTRSFASAQASLTLSIDTAGAITVAGQSVSMALSVALSTQGAITLQGQSVGLSLGIPIVGGAMTLAGQSVTMAFGVAQDVAGSITFAGQTVAMSLGAGVVIDTPGAITLAGQSVTMTLGLAVAPGAITIAGQSMTMAFDTALAAGAITLAGQSLSMNLDVALSAGSITFAGQTVALANGANLTLDIDVPGSIVLSGQSLTLTGGTPVAGSEDGDEVIRRRRRR